MHSAYPYKRQVQSATAKIGIICHISFTLSKKVTNNAILNFMRNYRETLGRVHVSRTESLEL